MTTINTIDDFLKILDDHPSWLEAVRARIVGHVLLQLPGQLSALTSQVNELTSQVNALTGRFDALTIQVNELTSQVNALTIQVNELTGRFDAFVERVDAFIAEQIQFNERVEVFISEQIQFNGRVEVFIAEQRRFNANAEARMNRIESDIGNVKGGHLQLRLIELAPVLIEDLDCDLIELLTRGELIKMSRQIPDATRGERRSFNRADLIVLVKDCVSGETFYLAAEASWTADLRDTDRAQRNARYLTQITGRPAVPAIISHRNTREVETLIASGAVRWMQLDENDLAAH